MKSVYIPTPKCASNAIKKLLSETFNLIEFHPHPQSRPLHFLPSVNLGGGNPLSLTASAEEFTAWANSSPVCSVQYWKPADWIRPWHTVDGYEDQSELSFVSKAINTFPLPNNSHFAKNFFLPTQFYSWTVTRNPWERMASAWAYLSEKKVTNLDFYNFIDITCSYKILSDPLLCGCSSMQKYPNSNLGRLVKADAMRLIETLQIEPSFPMAHDKVTSIMRLWPYHYRMHDCNSEVYKHVQRWEDSRLFTGETLVNTMTTDSRLVTIRNQQPRQITKVINFDFLQTGFNEVMDDLGMPKQKLPHTHKGTIKKNEYQKLYNTETVMKVWNWHRYEIEKFGHRFERN